MARICELFAIDAEARDAGMDHAARHVLRGERSRPLNWIHVGSELRDYLADVLPGLGSVQMQRVGQYTPAAWGASRSSK